MSKANRSGCVLVVLVLLGGGLYFLMGTQEGKQLLARWRAWLHADRLEKEKQERQALQDKLNAILTEAVAVPDALAGNTEGKQAYEAWHRARRLLREYSTMEVSGMNETGRAEQTKNTEDTLVKLAASTTVPEVKDLLISIRDTLVVNREESNEKAKQSVKNVNGEPQIDPDWLDTKGFRRRENERMTKLQDLADANMTKLALRTGADFPRITVRNARLPLPESEETASSRLLVGSWELKVNYQGTQISGVETFWDDGRLGFTGTVTPQGGQPSAVNFRGVWRIEGKKLHTKLLHTSGPVANRAGSSDVDEIVKLTADEKTIRDSMGRSETARKIK